MKLTNKIRNILGRNDAKRLAEGIANTYTENKVSGEEHPIDSTVEKIMDIIKENNNPETIREVLRRILEKEEIPNRVFEKTAREISKDKEIPNDFITEVVEESKTNVPDSVIATIVDESDMNTEQRLQLMKNVEDKKILEQRMKNELIILYKNCKEKRDNEVVERIEEIKSFLDGETNEEIDVLVQKVIAKKMAENYYSDIKKGTKIYTLSKIIPVEEMIEIDLPSKVQEEYRKKEEIEGKKEGRFNKDDLTAMILREMARNIVKKYEETRTFIIPQSDNMRNLDKKQEQDFINAIEVFFGQELSQQEVTNIEGQIRGTRGNLEELLKQIRKIPEERKRESIDMLAKLVQDSETIKTLGMLADRNLLKTLNEMPIEKRERTIESIDKVLENRKYHVADKTPRIEQKQNINYRKETSEGR